MKTITVVLCAALALGAPRVSHSEPQNVQPANIVNYGPSGGNGGEGLCMQQLVLTTKDFEKQKLERDIAVREMNYMKENDSSHGWIYLLLGVAAGAAAGYAAFGRGK